VSYKVNPSVLSPFALLTLSSSGTMAQWDQSTEAWVTASNTWSGDAMMFGVPAVDTSGSGAIGSIKFDVSGTNREEHSQQFAGVGAARSKSDDQMVAYGSDASFSIGNVAGVVFTIDSTRARCVVMRVSL
jgi:hypothetical protein